MRERERERALGHDNFTFTKKIQNDMSKTTVCIV